MGIEALQPSLCINVDHADRAPIPGGHWVPHPPGWSALSQHFGDARRLPDPGSRPVHSVQ